MCSYLSFSLFTEDWCSPDHLLVCLCIDLSIIYLLWVIKPPPQLPSPVSMWLKWISIFRLIHPPVYVTSPFDKLTASPQGLFFKYEPWSRQCLALTQQLKHFRIEVCVVLLTFSLWLHKGSCSISIPELHSTQEERRHGEGQRTSKKLHQQLPSFPWICQSNGVSYLYIVLVGIMPTFLLFITGIIRNKERPLPDWIRLLPTTPNLHLIFLLPLRWILIHSQNHLTSMILWLNHPPQHLHQGSAPSCMPLGKTHWPVG